MTLQDFLMISGTIIIMIVLIKWVKKRNPSNRKITTYYKSEDVFKKMKCPYCDIRMKKIWEKEEFNPLSFNTSIQREFVAVPKFICSRCGREFS